MIAELVLATLTALIGFAGIIVFIKYTTDRATTRRKLWVAWESHSYQIAAGTLTPPKKIINNVKR